MLFFCGRWYQQRQATTCFKLRCLKLEEYCYEQFCSDLKLHLSLVYSIVKCSTIEKCNEDCRGGNGKRPVATDLTVRLLCFSEAARQKLLDNGVAPPVTMLVRMMMMMMVDYDDDDKPLFCFQLPPINLHPLVCPVASLTFSHPPLHLYRRNIATSPNVKERI